MRLSQGVVDEIQQLQREIRRLRGPRATWHVGDIAWGFRQHEGREGEWRIRLWVEDGCTVAWSWLKNDGRAMLEFDVHPDHPLDIVIERLAQTQGTLPVVDRRDTGRVLGIITRDSLLDTVIPR